MCIAGFAGVAAASGLAPTRSALGKPPLRASTRAEYEATLREAVKLEETAFRNIDTPTDSRKDLTESSRLLHGVLYGLEAHSLSGEDIDAKREVDGAEISDGAAIQEVEAEKFHYARRLVATALRLKEQALDALTAPPPPAPPSTSTTPPSTSTTPPPTPTSSLEACVAWDNLGNGSWEAFVDVLDRQAAGATGTVALIGGSQTTPQTATIQIGSAGTGTATFTVSQPGPYAFTVQVTSPTTGQSQRTAFTSVLSTNTPTSNSCTPGG
jgi:hypothetical protein